MNFPARQHNTLDLIFTTRPLFKVRCKPLPQIGLKSNRDIVLLDTSHQPLRTRLPRRKIFLWKKANFEEIKNHFTRFNTIFQTKSFNSIDEMWTDFKTAVAAAVERFVPTKAKSPLACQADDEAVSLSDTGSYRRKYKDRPVPLNTTMYRK